jgi:predicted nucleic acid-binding protein
MSAEFCDTSVFVYAYDRSAGSKAATARRLLARLWTLRAGALSIQVLQELFVTLTRKTSPPLSADAVRALISDLAAWQVVEPTSGDVLDAIDGAARWQISFWDAMLLTTARKADAETLWSEDLNHGQDYDGVVVRNPFRGQPVTQSP